MPQKIKKEKGFTLIELLLVIAIISLLSSVSFFSFTEAKKKGEDAKMKAESSEVRKAIELYKQDNDGKVPVYALKGQMVRERGQKNSTTNKTYYEEAMEKLVPKYLPKVPESPSGEGYAYLATEDETQAAFSAYLNSPDSSDSNNNVCSIVGAPEADIIWQDYYSMGDSASLSLTCSQSNVYCYYFDTMVEGNSIYKNICIDNIPVSSLNSYIASGIYGSNKDEVCTTIANANLPTWYPDGLFNTIVTYLNGPYTEPACGGSYENDYCVCI